MNCKVRLTDLYVCVLSRDLQEVKEIPEAQIYPMPWSCSKDFLVPLLVGHNYEAHRHMATEIETYIYLSKIDAHVSQREDSLVGLASCGSKQEIKGLKASHINLWKGVNFTKVLILKT